jgi:stealth protein CR2/Stealth-like protein
MDVVYTWVKGDWPGYWELLQSLAAKPQDLNPNRYRDLDLLKYSLRSLEAYVPWRGRVTLVTARPQVPAWLRTGDGLRVVHHDEFMDAADLPTFNSFAIFSNLHRLPGISRRFLYVEDDYFFGRTIDEGDLVAPDGRVKIYRKLERLIAASREDRPGLSPWEAALAHTSRLLDERYGPGRRRVVGHVPLIVDVACWGEMVGRWGADFRRTSASRFRSSGNVAPEQLYGYYMLREGKGVAVPPVRAYRDSTYHGLGNWLPWQRLALRYIRWLRPKFYCLNDGFGQRPNPRVVALVRKALETAYPRRSRFERPPAT